MRRPSMRPLSLRTKVAAAFLAVAAILALVVGVLGYQTAALLIQGDAEQRFDDAVDRAAAGMDTGPGLDLWIEEGPGQGTGTSGSEDLSVQVVRPDGTVFAAPGLTSQLIPPSTADLAAAGAAESGVIERYEREVDGEHYRMAAVSFGGGRGALQLSQPLAPTEHLLDVLGTRMLLVGAVGTVAAGAFGWLVAWRVTRRLGRLTATAERISASGRLDDVEPGEADPGADEVGRLAGAFNAMLARLAGAREDQRRLVEDAAHELRTPLTSLRTNVELLDRLDSLPQEDRERLLADLAGETRELSQLVGEVVQLATDQTVEEEPRRVDLAELVQRAADRGRRRSGHEVEVVVESTPTEIVGRMHALQRAMMNLVDNAVKFGDAEAGPVQIAVGDHRVEVRDRGPGIDEADLARVFDRFYRAPAARSRPGSGLGLAIVRDVAARHGGEAYAYNREGGGAVIGFTLAAPDR